MHGVLNQIQWNKLRPFHGSDSGEQTKLWSKIIVHNFAKQKDLPSLVFQFKSWVYAKPNSGLCQFGANIPPVLGLDAIAQLTKKKFFFFCKNLIWYWHLQMDSSFPDTYITLGLAVVFDYTCVELILEAPQHIASIPIITNYTLNCSCNTMLYTSTNAMFESCWSFQFSLESMPKMRWKNIKV